MKGIIKDYNIKQYMNIAEEVIDMPVEQRIIYRKQHLYEIISYSCCYDKIYQK